jgi:two-component system CitB family sensor kinase
MLHTPAVRRLSLSGQLLILQMGIVVLVVLSVAGVSLVQTDAAFKRSESRRLLSSAETIAKDEVVRLGLSRGDLPQALKTAAEAGRSFAGASYVIVVDAQGRVRSSTLPLSDAGSFDFGQSDVRSGSTWTGTTQRYGDLSIEAHVPVVSAAEQSIGKRLGYVLVGTTYPPWWEVLGTAAPNVLSYLALAGVLGVLGSLLVARRVKRQTLGLEPREIAALVEQREAMLHGVREGVIGVDLAGRVAFANDEAIRLLSLEESPVGKAVERLGQQPEVTRILLGRGGDDDTVAAVSSRLLVLNTQPIQVRGRQTGSVTSMRDRTELLGLQHALAVAQSGTDTLRAQVHEFQNRLHAISGMAELGEREELLAFVRSLSHAIDVRVSEVAEKVEDPAVAALLVAKSSRAAEIQVEFQIEESAHLRRHAADLSADLVTVIGNLVDNAFEAVGRTGGRVCVDLRDDGRQIVVRVTDTGAGIPPDLIGEVFQPGWTSKAGADAQGHGWGLALTRMACQRHGGDVVVEPGDQSAVAATLFDRSTADSLVAGGAR